MAVFLARALGLQRQ